MRDKPEMCWNHRMILAQVAIPPLARAVNGELAPLLQRGADELRKLQHIRWGLSRCRSRLTAVTASSQGNSLMRILEQWLNRGGPTSQVSRKFYFRMALPPQEGGG